MLIHQPGGAKPIDLSAIRAPRIEIGGDHSEFGRIRREYEQLKLPSARGLFSRAGQVYAIIDHPFDPTTDLKLREANNFAVVRMFFNRLQQYPHDRIEGFALVDSSEGHLRPWTEQDTYKHAYFIRATHQSGVPPLPDRVVKPFSAPVDLTVPEERSILSSRKGNAAAFQGFVSRKGNGFAILETPGHPFELDANPFVRDDFDFLQLHVLWDNIFGGECQRLNTSWSQGKGRFLFSTDRPVALNTSLLRFRGWPGTQLEELPPPPVGPIRSKFDEISRKERRDNARAEHGLAARNGFFWAYPSYVGEPDLRSEEVLPMGNQNAEALRVLVDFDNHPDHATWEIKAVHFSKKFGNHLRSPKEEYNLDGHEVPLFDLPVRGRDTAVPLPTRSPEKARENPGKFSYDPRFLNPVGYVDNRAPALPKTIPEGLGSRNRGQNLAAEGLARETDPLTGESRIVEDLYLNRFGEGFMLIDMVEAPLAQGENSYGEQRWEVVKRLVEFHNLHPFLEIEEAAWWRAEGEFLTPSDYSVSRNWFMRVRDFDWENNPQANSIVAKVREYRLPVPQTVMQLHMHAAFERNLDSWMGLENKQGEGFAMVEMVTPLPSAGEKNPRETNAVFCKLATAWSEQFPWRKVENIEFVRRWAGHKLPEHVEESYSYTMIVHFRRRPGFENFQPEDELARIRQGEMPWSREAIDAV